MSNHPPTNWKELLKFIFIFIPSFFVAIILTASISNLIEDYIKLYPLMNSVFLFLIISLVTIIIMFYLYKRDSKSPSNKKSNLYCQKCNKTLSNSNKYGFDIADQINQQGEQEILCSDCLTSEWIKHLEKTKIRFISIEHIKGYNSYSFIPIYKSDLWGIKKDKQKELTSLINNLNHSCESCSSKAITMFITDPKFFDTKTQNYNSVQKRYYCEKHFVKNIVESFIEKGKSIDLINIPYDKEGVYLPGEY